MAFYSGFGNYGYPTAFAPSFAPTFVSAPIAAEAPVQHEENQSQAVSVSGFQAAPMFQSTFLPSTQFVPVAAPAVRRPGYNERLIAWRNRQKAFNKYKKATKAAIKNAANAQFAGPAYFPGYGAQPTVYGTQFGAGFGTVLPYGTQYPVMFEQAAPAAEGEATYGDFSYSQQQAEVQHEEPEIRGTQV